MFKKIAIFIGMVFCGIILYLLRYIVWVCLLPFYLWSSGILEWLKEFWVITDELIYDLGIMQIINTVTKHDGMR